jgi:hypothetical protein
MHTTSLATGLRLTTLSVALLATVTNSLSAQGEPASSRPLRVTAISGGMSHGSALVVDRQGASDTRLSPGVVFGLEIQHATFSFASLFAGVVGSFSTLEHGANLGVVAGPGSSGATVILGTAGLMFEATDWFESLRPTLRVGGGLKAYNFTTNGASSSAVFTGDIGAGFRGGVGPIEISGEVRYLPSAFDQAKLPLRGLTPQDQRQTDLLFTVGVTIKP